MSKYTTGEIAKLCGVSVRTVQYYDSRGILIPSELSEGGRRLYSEDDLGKMKIICFLRDVGLSINSIGSLFEDEDTGAVISILLEQQEQSLKEEIDERREKLEMVEQIKRELKRMDDLSLESIGDIANVMENRKKLRRVRSVILGLGLVGEAVEIGAIIFGIVTGIWYPFVVGFVIELLIAAWLLRYYFKRVDYICPKCHTVFRPKFSEMLFANHTSTTRRLTCTHCGAKSFCVETYRKEG